MKSIGRGMIGLVMAASIGNGCSGVPEDNLYHCDPDAIIPSARCVEEMSGDAGPNGNGGAGGTATSKPADFEDPGLTPDTWAPCGDGFCAPEPSGPKAIGWDKVPVSLYVGPNDGTPLACPDKLKEVGVFYDDLVAPPASCEACTCEASKGDCSEPPTKIEIRAGTCAESGVPFSPFDGPPNWTGTCSSEGGLSAGAMCGAEPCAQSVWASPLPAPKDDACMPTSAIPLSTKEFTWSTHALACQAETPLDACTSKTQYCAANLGPEWLTCVHKPGIHDLSDCPDEYKASVHRLYPEAPIDDRGCTECACGAPVGSACIGKMRIYDDAACSKEFFSMPLGSMGVACSNVIPAGSTIGAKRVTDLAYLDGTCGPTGGEPKGVATGDTANAVTFCCIKGSPPMQPQAEPE